MLSFRSLSLGLCLASLPCVAIAELGPIVVTASRTEQPRNSVAAVVRAPLASMAAESST